MAIEVEETALENIKPDQTNANRHTQRGEGMIRESLHKFGFAEAGTLDKNNRLIGGNLRTEAAADIGMDEAIIVDIDGTKPVYIRRNDLDLENADDTRAKELAYALNRVPQISIDFDPEILAADLAAGVDLSKFFTEDELKIELSELGGEPIQEPGELDIDKADELRQEWGTELGQIWQLGRHRVACGDCTDRGVVKGVMDGEVADLCLTDPPYGIDINSNANNFGVATHKSRRASNDTWDKQIPEKSVFDMIFSLSDNQIIFGANYFWEQFYSTPCYIVWDKRGGLPDVPFADTEFAWTSFAKQTNKRYVVINHGFIRDDKEDRYHPTQKPLKLFTLILDDFSSKDRLILDPFLGSGTTLIAAHQLDRRCYGLEIDPGYVAVILQRYYDLTDDKPILLGGD